MAAGARLAAERDRWPAPWQIADLDAEQDELLEALEVDEELDAAVPGLLHDPDGDRPPRSVLVAVTGRRVLLVARAGGETVRVYDATRCARRVDRGAPVLVHGRTLVVDVDAVELIRMWELVDALADA